MRTKQLHFILLVIGLLFFQSQALQGQIALDWVTRDVLPTGQIGPQLGSQGADVGKGVALDAQGNVYSVFGYKEAGASTQISMGIVKYDVDGNVIWRRSLQAKDGSAKVDVYPTNILVGPTGVYFAAYAGSEGASDAATQFLINEYTTTTQTAIHIANSAAGNKYKAIIAKLDTAGNYVWSNTIDRLPFAGVAYGTAAAAAKDVSDFSLSDIAIDNSENVYFVGTYADDSLFIGNKRLQRYTCRTNCTSGGITKNTTRKPFFGKYNRTGVFEWVKIAEFAENSSGNGIAISGTDVYVCGRAVGSLEALTAGGGGCATCYEETNPNALVGYSSIDTNGLAAGQPLDTTTRSYAFVFKYSSTGALNWTGKIGGNNDESANDIVATNSDVYVLLHSKTSYTDDYTYINTSGSNNSSTNLKKSLGLEGAQAAYLVKLSNSIPSKYTYLYNSKRDLYDKQVHVDWVQGLESSGRMNIATGSSLTTDGDGNVILVATQESGVDYYDLPMDNSSSKTSTTNSNVTIDMIFGKYTNAGERVYIKVTGGQGLDFALGCTANEEKLMVVGRFSGSCDFEPAPSIASTVSSYGAFDAFVAQYTCFKPIITARNAAFCENSAITLDISAECPSGVCNYAYRWTDRVNNQSFTTSSSEYTFSGALGANGRKIEITDGNTGCISSDSIDIIVEPEITLSVTPTSTLVCAGTDVTFTANVTPANNVAFKWNRSGDTTTLSNVSNLVTKKAGSYTVVADRNGCQSQASVTLNNYIDMSPLVSPDTPTICGGGAIAEVLDCPGCSYTWVSPPGSSVSSNASTIVADVAGRYRVNIADANGCTYQREVDIINRPYLTPIIYGKDALDSTLSTICNGRPLTLHTTDPVVCPTCSYLWSDGTTGPYNFAYGASTHTVTVTDNGTGCVGVSSPLNITVTTLAAPTLIGDPTNSCKTGSSAYNNAVLEVESPCVFCKYKWYQRPDHTTALPNSGLRYQTKDKGDYYVTVQDTFGCTENSNLVTVDTAINSTISLTTNTNRLCGGNEATISTIPCSSCDYEWYYFDIADTSKIVISGASSLSYTDTSTSTAVLRHLRMVEIYASGDISDLSQYKLGVDTNFGNLGDTLKYNLPAVSLSKGDYFYIATNTVAFRNYFGFNPDLTLSVPDTGVANGNDAVFIQYQGQTVDVLGHNTNSNGHYVQGWQYRKTNRSPQSNYVTADWNKGGLIACFPNSGCTTPFPIGTFSNTIVPTQNFAKKISNQDSSVLTTNKPNTYYAVVKYPNGCYERSANNINIIKDVFTPQILGNTPVIAEVEDEQDPIYQPAPSNIVYSCNGRSVVIGMTGTYETPPNWSYQWLFNGDTIIGETGFSIITDSIGTYTLIAQNRNGCTSTSNQVEVRLSTNASTPIIVANPVLLCDPAITSSTLIAPNYINTNYLWRKASNNSTGNNNDSIIISEPNGYFVITTDSSSLCSYASPIVEVKDTAFPAPTLIATSSPLCATGPINLSTSTCSNCEYEWQKLDTVTGNFNIVATTLQNIYAINTSGKYRVKINNFGSCNTEASNIVQASFQDINAGIATPAVTSICNNNTVTIDAIPDSTICSGCTYLFQRDGIDMQPTTSIYDFQQVISQGGNYRVIITNSDGCEDTSGIVTFQDISVGTSIRQSTGKICGSTACVDLEIDRCIGCTYQWYYEGNALSNRDTFAQACGYTSKGKYSVDVTAGGCVFRDSIVLDTAAPLIVNIALSPNSQFPTVCGDRPVEMLDVCTNCSGARINYQWLIDGNPIPQAGFQAYLADSAGSYQVEVVDTNNCREISNAIPIQKFEPDPAFALDFSPLGPAIPYTTSDLHLDDYLMPVNLRNNATGRYTSLTAGPAIFGNKLDSLRPSTAGAGRHVITFSYDDSDCTFSTFDTLEILDPMGMTLANDDTLAPSDEACILDFLTITLTNFTFIPDTVRFVIAGNRDTSIKVNPVVTSFAGVYSGTVRVRVPRVARTGKIKLVSANGASQYTYPNFVQVQNPAASINVVGTTLPLCSSNDTAKLIGLPAVAGSRFEVHYVSMPNDPTLISNDSLILENITGYDATGTQQVYAVYVFNPTYSNGLGICPAARDSALFEVRNSEIDSVIYSPIAISQPIESMENLRRITYPYSAMEYAHTYTGTYVINGDVLASSVPDLAAPGVNREEITYQINNGGCVNESQDSLDVWPAPAILDSIPNYVCRSSDTVFIERTTTALNVTYRNQLIYTDSRYIYQFANRTFAPDIIYNEQLNIMEIYSSNGGLDSINYVTPVVGSPQLFYFVPANVTGNNTTLTFRFRNRRLTTYLNAQPSSYVDTVDYIVSEVQKVINIETPPTVSISPVVLADTNFCFVNLPVQMSGLPSGGDFYFGDTTTGAALSPLVHNGNANIFNATDYMPGNSYKLKYIYNGQACSDSSSTGIYIPDSFSIALQALETYCATSVADSISFSFQGNSVQIDSNSTKFYIGGALSTPVFDPIQNYPLGSDTLEFFPVEYVVSDIYGCEQSDTAVFNVFPTPNIGITFPASTSFCLNDAATPLDLSINYWWANNFDVFSVNSPYATIPDDNIGSGSVTLKGAGILVGGNSTFGPNPSNAVFEPDSAGVGMHQLVYTYSDSLGCTDSINMQVEILPLPIVNLTLDNGDALQHYYCENDTILLKGSPQSTNPLYFGFGYHTNVVNHSLGSPGYRLDTLSPTSYRYNPDMPGTSPGIANDTLFYWFEIAATGCRDTALRPVIARNFTTDPTIVGMPQDTCASDYEVGIGLNLNGGLDLATYGTFSSSDVNAFYMPPNGAGVVEGDTVVFYPDSASVKYASRNVVLKYTYSDTARLCSTFVTDTAYIHALPALTLSEATFPNIQPLGTRLTLPNNPNDTFNHICERFDALNIYPYNQTGYYVGNQVVLNTPDLISPDTGVYNLSTSGVDSAGSLNGASTLAFAYFPNSIKGGKDTIIYRYTDATGCTDSTQQIIVVDTIPNLSFAGLGNFDPVLNRHVYCEKALNPPLILPSPIGVDWTLTLGTQNITAIPFRLRPDTLVVPGTYTDYPLEYAYIGQRYVDGAICSDTLTKIIQIRPAPILNWATTVPLHFCVKDSQQRVPLAAIPTGGIFVDQTFGVIAGIVADTLFNPTAQAGIRNIEYRYTDPVSGCKDQIQRTIEVYTLPKITFDVEGGCQGNQIQFVPEVKGIDYNGVAIDSISMVIWNFGDGVIDTLLNLPDTLVVPSDTHTYVGTGIFYPSLTVWNQGKCDTTFARRVIISPVATPTVQQAYVENFDASSGGWFQASATKFSNNGVVNDSLWQWGVANGTKLSTRTNGGGGNTVWGTRILNPVVGQNTYRQGENAWVYSPCFDLTQLDKPMIQMSIMRNMQDNVDGAVLQYHDDATNTWKVLGKPNKGINWYNDGFVVSAPGGQTGTPIGWTGNSRTATWENARYRLDNVGNDLRNRSDVRFRVAFASDNNTALGVNEGILFDSVKVGNRSKNVLVEHFSGRGYIGIEAIEQQLYNTIYNALYGRDVTLIQYHTEKAVSPSIPGFGTDPLYRYNIIDVEDRIIDYSITAVNQVRIDGKNLVGTTSQMLSYPDLEFLDIESLRDPEFALEFVLPGGGMYIDPNGTITATISVTAMQNLPIDEYVMRLVVTEDSIETTNSHITKAVMRHFLPSYGGIRYNRAWATGDNDIYSLVDVLDLDSIVASRAELVVMMQNVNTKEVYQVVSSRNITQWIGAPVDSIDVSVENLPNLTEWEVIDLNLYPNPAQDYFQVEFTQPLEGDYDWQLIDALGRVLKSGETTKGTEKMQVETTTLSSGMYIFTIKNDNIYTQRKVIIRRP